MKHARFCRLFLLSLWNLQWIDLILEWESRVSYLYNFFYVQENYYHRSWSKDLNLGCTKFSLYLWRVTPCLGLRREPVVSVKNPTLIPTSQGWQKPGFFFEKNQPTWVFWVLWFFYGFLGFFFFFIFFGFFRFFFWIFDFKKSSLFYRYKQR